MNYAGLLNDIFPAEGDAELCAVCGVNPAVGSLCSECAAQVRAIGDKLGARLTRRVQRQRKKGGN